MRLQLNRRPWLLVLLLAMLIGPVAWATAAEAVSDQVIAARDEAPSDQELRTRLQGIFEEMEALQGIAVTAREGVIKLTGEAVNDSAVDSALSIAERLSGVVAVEENVRRSLDVASSLEPVLDDLQRKALQWYRGLPLYLFALLLFGLLVWLGLSLANWKSLWNRVAPTPFLAELIAQLVRVLSIGIALVLTLQLVGAAALVGTVLGGAGILSLAIGFAIRDTIENYIASILLSLRQPFRPNDHVVIGDDQGFVVRLTSRATILMTLEGNQLRIPNSIVFKSVILNYTSNPERRFSFELGVDASDDPTAALEVGLAAIDSYDFVLDQPSPGAHVVSVGDSNIVVSFRAWINQRETDLLKARSQAIRSVKEALEREGFTLPEPVYRLRFDNRLQLQAGGEDAEAAAERPGSGVAGPHPEDDRATPTVEQSDVEPDNYELERVVEERAKEAGENLLDENRPAE